MDIWKILRESIDILKANYVIIVPTVVATVVIAVLSIMLIGGGIASFTIMGGSPAGSVAAISGMMGLALILLVISAILAAISHGMVIAMAKEAAETGKTSMNSGMDTAMGRLAHLIVAGILVSIIIVIGTFLLVAPGLVAAFFLMFTFVGIVAGGLGPLEAMKKSFELVKKDIKDSLLVFIAILVIGFVMALAGSILSVIPVLGQLAGMGLTGLSAGYISIVLVKAYEELTKEAPKTEVE